MGSSWGESAPLKGAWAPCLCPLPSLHSFLHDVTWSPRARVTVLDGSGGIADIALCRGSALEVAQRGGYPDLLPFLVSPQGSLMAAHAGAPSRAKKTQKRGWPGSASSWVETFIILPTPTPFFLCEPLLKSLLNLLQYYFCFIFWFLGCEACRILTPWPGTKAVPPALEGEVLTTGPPGKCPCLYFLIFLPCLILYFLIFLPCLILLPLGIALP